MQNPSIFSSNFSQTKDYPFGMVMPGRAYTSESYRYGFNGMEKDGEEWTGNEGSHLDFGARIYDSRLGRWFSPDPLENKYPEMSTYSFVGNMPTIAIDPDGKQIWIIIDRLGSSYTQLKYSNGTLYNDDGSEYTGNNKFARYMQGELTKLTNVNDRYVVQVVKTLERSNQNHYIEQDPYNYALRTQSLNQMEAGLGNPTGSQIIVPGDESSDILKIYQEDDGIEESATSLIGHEIYHAYENNQGLAVDNDRLANDENDPTEQRATSFENRIRVRIGLEADWTYGGKEIPKESREDLSSQKSTHDDKKRK